MNTMSLYKKLVSLGLIVLTWLSALLQDWAIKQFSHLQSVDVPAPTALLYTLNNANIPFILAAILSLFMLFGLLRKTDWLSAILILSICMLLCFTLFSLWAVSLLVTPLS